MLPSTYTKKIKGAKVMRILKLFLLAFLSSFLGCVNSSHNSEIEELRNFGTKTFNEESWRIGTAEDRGSQIFDYVNRKNKKLDLNKIKSDLGESTAYYEYDNFPAYYIGKNNAYIVVFILDHNTNKVKNIDIIKGNENEN